MIQSFLSITIVAKFSILDASRGLCYASETQSLITFSVALLDLLAYFKCTLQLKYTSFIHSASVLTSYSLFRDSFILMKHLILSNDSI